MQVDLDSKPQRHALCEMAMKYAEDRRVPLLPTMKFELKVPDTALRLKEVIVCTCMRTPLLGRCCASKDVMCARACTRAC